VEAGAAGVATAGGVAVTVRRVGAGGGVGRQPGADVARDAADRDLVDRALEVTAVPARGHRAGAADRGLVIRPREQRGGPGLIGDDLVVEADLHPAGRPVVLGGDLGPGRAVGGDRRARVQVADLAALDADAGADPARLLEHQAVRLALAHQHAEVVLRV